MNILRKISDYTDQVVKYIVVICLFLMTADVLVQIFFRYVLNNSLSWAEEVARYLMIWMGLLGASSALKRRMHVGIDFFVEKAPKKIRKAISILLKIYLLYFLYILMKYSIPFAMSGVAEIAPATQIKMFWPYLAIPVGVGALIIQVIYLLAEDIVGQ